MSYEDWHDAAVGWLRTNGQPHVVPLFRECRIEKVTETRLERGRGLTIILAASFPFIAERATARIDAIRVALARTVPDALDGRLVHIEVRVIAPPEPTPLSPSLAGTLGSRAPIEWNGMGFRSHTEVRVAASLDEAEVLYFPLPTAVRRRVKKEPDFLIVHHGLVGILEVDGPHHTNLTRADEDRRAAWFEKSGVKLVRHYPVSMVDADPRAVVQEFLADLRGSRY